MAKCKHYEMRGGMRIDFFKPLLKTRANYPFGRQSKPVYTRKPATYRRCTRCRKKVNI